MVGTEVVVVVGYIVEGGVVVLVEDVVEGGVTVVLVIVNDVGVSLIFGTERGRVPVSSEDHRSARRRVDGLGRNPSRGA